MKSYKVLSKFFLSFFFVLVLLFAGCGKQDADSDVKLEKGGKIAQGQEVELMAEGVPLYEEEIEDFDDSSINEFAVVENDDFNSFDDSDGDSFKVADLSQEEDLFAKDLDDVNWEDEELLALEEESGFADSYKFKNVQFNLNKYGTKKDQKNVLDENIKTAKRAVEDGKVLTIIGHGCQLGDASFNMPLSENRAKTIKKVFVKNGIPEDKVKILGMGQEKPLVWSNQTDKDQLIAELSPNRRVEIIVN